MPTQSAVKREIIGLKQTLNLTALVKIIYFGLPLLLAPQTVAAVFGVQSFAEPQWITFLGAVSIALGLGAYLTAHNPEAASVMVPVLTVAEGLSAVLMAVFVLGGILPSAGWINFAILAILAGLNARQLTQV